MQRFRLFLIAVLLSGALLPLSACATGWGEPERVGLAAYGGMGYDPGNEVRWALLSVSALYDYDAIWFHRAPDPLRFKVEGNLGVGGPDEARLVAAAGIMALYYLDGLSSARFRPYGEAGIGLIYTDFQVPEQGLRLNFNPRAGLGCEFGGTGRPWFAAVHLHHLSNGDLHSDNRGINSVLLQLGRAF